MASLHVKTAFDVAKPSAVSHIMTSNDTNGYLVAAFLEEMKDVRGSACIENCETWFRYSICIRQGSFVVRAEEKWKRRRWGLSFGGTYDEKSVPGGMMWADI